MKVELMKYMVNSVELGHSFYHLENLNQFEEFLNEYKPQVLFTSFQIKEIPLTLDQMCQALRLAKKYHINLIADAGRETLTIKDEYDVQDLLHALLKLHFSDVRPEEWTPSYAGNSNRMDFLLKEAHIAIEVKMTRDNLKDKEIGEQLIIDIDKYQQHPDVNTLYCFVYDPNAILHNPVGLATN